MIKSVVLTILLASLGECMPGWVVAGEIHYSRIPEEYWNNRLDLVKAMGFNALSVYVMWNYHEIEQGKFDFESSGKNLYKFITLAKARNFSVLLRPGPYVCAEWDLGGMPARLLSIPDIEFRANNAIFLNEVQTYFAALASIVRPFVGNTIVALQIENEYGFYGTDKTYFEQLRKIWIDLDLPNDHYYVDTVENVQKMHWNGAIIGINNAVSMEQYSFVRTFE